MKTNRLAIILLLLVMACVPITEPEPVEILPPECFGFDPDDEFEIISVNYCLDAPWITTSRDGLIQVVPDGFEIVNILENADGYPDNWTDRARIEYDQYSCEFQVHNGVTGINGAWGYRQTAEVEAGCHLLKATGYSWINDPKIQNITNYYLLGYVNGEQIGAPIFSTQGEFEIIFPVMLESGEVTFAVLVGIAWATPGEGSYLDLVGIGLLAVLDGFCD